MVPVRCRASRPFAVYPPPPSVKAGRRFPAWREDRGSGRSFPPVDAPGPKADSDGCFAACREARSSLPV